ncbi:60S ribosomal protein l23 [Trifolium pratense]|uniref:60S ribosomal protein l23 n=1 Tax=Trifolium pratense TaxID=57577 RepID=A0A2K3LTU4_TRIPR|nr:60S ribosomal protein l23 [Trifolium pratense]
MQTEVWQKVNLYMTNAMGFAALVFELIDVLEPTAVANVAMILWTLVEAQSEVQIGKNSRSNTGNGVQENSWTKPPRGSLKCNIDIARSVEQNIYCIGACIHDEHGHFVQAFVKRCDGKPEIVEAEAIGMLEVLKWLHTSCGNERPISIETDRLQVEQAIKKQSVNNTELGSIIYCTLS